MRFHIRDLGTGLVIARNLTRVQADACLDAHPTADLAVIAAK